MTASPWRLAAAAAVLAILGFLTVRLVPIYLHNLELQRFVADISHRSAAATRSDDVLRAWVLNKANDLDLPVRAGNVDVQRTSDTVRVEVRYVVRVDLPLYTVNLHFYPGAGSQ